MSEQEKRNFPSRTILELLIALIPFILYILLFNRLPDRVAVHYGADNVPNRWAPKLSVDMIIQCSLGFFGLIFGKALNWFCVTINTDQSNIKAVRKIMRITELFLTAFFCFLSVYFLSVLVGQVKLSSGYIWRIALAGLSVLWIAIGNYLPKMSRNSTSGIRTLSALKDEDVWFKVQRFGGKAFILFGIAGLVLALSAFIPAVPADVLIAILFAVTLITICIYSGLQGAKPKK
jgi:Predicted integral membrane protein